MASSTLMKLSLAIGTAAFVMSAANATEITVELAKQCRELMVKAYPPVMAGSARGNAVQEREYFRTCVAQGGKMDETPSTDGRGKK